ncbi:DUF1499 domain-containing protein [Kaistia sp. MMO-174]|uniref:DUF1499 domain-containing protein n=1 Tax=Kaistia sp. MMO-174 TaxID=3081256 RepID=UPI003017A630
MTARPFEREARTAPWSLRLALLPIPLLIVAVVMHRYEQIDTTPFFVVVAIAWAIALIALVLGAIAMRQIWIDGVLGFGRALAGSLLAALVLVMPGLVIEEMIRLPRLADISTDTSDPPAFGPTVGMAHPLPDAADNAEQAKAYPDILPRHYPVSPPRVFDAVMTLVGSRGWKVGTANAPDAENADASVDAVAKTLVLALPADVAIRILADDDGSLVDMRSASRIGSHDLGDNARRIRSFFEDLDAALQGVAEPAEGDETELPPLPPVSPRAR